MDDKYDPGAPIGDHQIFFEGDDIPEILSSQVSATEIINTAKAVLDFIRYVCNLNTCVPDVLYFTDNEHYIPVPTTVAARFYEWCKKSSDPNRGMQVILKALYAGISPEKVLHVLEGSEQENPSYESADDSFVTLSLVTAFSSVAEALKKASTTAENLSESLKEMADEAIDTPTVASYKAAEEKFKMIEKVRRHRARKGRKGR